MHKEIHIQCTRQLPTPMTSSKKPIYGSSTPPPLPACINGFPEVLGPKINVDEILNWAHVIHIFMLTKNTPKELPHEFGVAHDLLEKAVQKSGNIVFQGCIQRIGYELGDEYELDSEQRKAQEELYFAIKKMTRILQIIKQCKPSRSGYKLKYNIVTKTFSYRNKSCPLRANSNLAVLCDSFYPICPNSGKVHWKDLITNMKKLYPDFYREKTPNKEKIREMIKDLKRWSTNPKQDLGVILEIGKEHVQRKK
jgi:hypothetical protein